MLLSSKAIASNNVDTSIRNNLRNATLCRIKQIKSRTKEKMTRTTLQKNRKKTYFLFLRNKGFYTSPIRTIKTTDENSLGILSTVGFHCVNSEFPPNDSYESLLEWTKEYLDPEYYLILKSTKVYSPLAPYRRVCNDRKYVELLGKKWPHNYILLGDAMCTFNPQFGQGMTHACRQARELGEIFAENSYPLKTIPHIFNRRASAISGECWLISTSNDWKTPTLKVIKTDQNGNTKTYHRNDDGTTAEALQLQTPLMIQFLQWYNGWFVKCASKSGRLTTDFLRVMNQHSSPFLLMKPTTFLTVCYNALMNYFKLSKQ